MASGSNFHVYKSHLLTKLEELCLEDIRPIAASVRVADASSRVYKDECCILFDTPFSEHGLFVCLQTFRSFGRNTVMSHFQKFGNPLYLNIKKTKVKKSSPGEAEQAEKPTVVGIGVQGGFPNEDYEIREELSLVRLPDFAFLSLPVDGLPEELSASIASVIAAESASRQEDVASWVAERRKKTVHGQDLWQKENVTVPPKASWKCAYCDLTENLWMNLSDGTIVCARHNWDGSGGNNHGVDHYEKTGYPLAVKLGTINADLDKIDVWSYPEDDLVEDPLLRQHLEHFGINIFDLEKTEKSLGELELDQNLALDFSRIEEKGQVLEPLFGPGYTGIINIGNSCYLGSTMQVLYTLTSFRDEYISMERLFSLYQELNDPFRDLTYQMLRLGVGLLSGEYSMPARAPEGSSEDERQRYAKSQDGILPRLFKTCVGRGHPEFSTSGQQDALEFFQYLLELLKRESRAKGDGASGRVRYTTREENSLTVVIPLEKATNIDQVAAFQAERVRKEEAGQRIEPEEIVRPQVKLIDCLEETLNTATLEGFVSPVTGEKTTAKLTPRFLTFPDVLTLHMRRFVAEEGTWLPKKLDCMVDVPEVLDLEDYRGVSTVQHDEEALPENSGESRKIQADPEIIMQLASMGFPENRCEKAAISTDNGGVEVAMNWLLEHMEDSDIDEPVQSIEAQSEDVNEEAVLMLTSMGFTEKKVRRALRETGGDANRAADWLFSHADEPDELPMQSLDVPDGRGKYELMAFISHIGSSTQSGHYVAHIKKEGKWVIFNDEKVAKSVVPPREFGYIYFYRRME